MHSLENSPFLSSQIFKNAKPDRPDVMVGDKIPPCGEKRKVLGLQLEALSYGNHGFVPLG